MIKQPQPIVLDNSKMTIEQPTVTKTVKVPLSMTFTGRRA